MQRFRANMLFQPDTNLRMGTYYLRSLLDSLQGQWEQALASYNAGKRHVTSWLTWNQFREPAEFVETIPFNETRNYVQSVLRNADVYRRLYGNVQVASQKLDNQGAATR
jgi:soluble lytic murein transglycosylase